jgi:hypothetical protein
MLTMTNVIAQRNRYGAQPFAIGEAAARIGDEHRVAPENKARDRPAEVVNKYCATWIVWLC